MSNLVFVYGTLKRCEGNDRYLSKPGAIFVGPAVTEDNFRMIHVGFPVIFKDEAGKPVAGEVYRVSDDTLKRLDGLEGEGRMYHRHRIDITMKPRDLENSDLVKDAEIRGGELKEIAYAYIGDDDYWFHSMRKHYTFEEDGHLVWNRDEGRKAYDRNSKLAAG